jgi:hypothetical protein
MVRRRQKLDFKYVGRTLPRVQRYEGKAHLRVENVTARPSGRFSRLSGSHAWHLDEAQQPAPPELARTASTSPSQSETHIRAKHLRATRRCRRPPRSPIEAMRPHLMGPGLLELPGSYGHAGGLSALTLFGTVSGEARQSQVFEQHRRMMSASVGLGSGRRLLPPI